MWSRTDPPSTGVVDILMYHSISDAGGPTSIPEPVFRSQMQTIAETGTRVISLDELLNWKNGDHVLTGPAVVLTFDDGFADFGSAAWPILRDHGWPATVFLPTGHVGKHEGWRGIAEPPRALMAWDDIAALSGEGVNFGGHSVSHPNLCDLDPEMLEQEIRDCREEILRRTGQAPRHFAPPYGLVNNGVRKAISGQFKSSCGTRLGRVGANSDIFDLPRLEMFYFTDPAHWRRHLTGRGATYLSTRKTLRAVRDAISRPWKRM